MTGRTPPWRSCGPAAACCASTAARTSTGRRLTRCGRRSSRSSAGRGSVTLARLRDELGLAPLRPGAPGGARQQSRHAASPRRPSRAAAVGPARGAVLSGGITYELTRIRLSDGRETTVYLVRHPRATTSPRVVCFDEPQRLDHWCVANEQDEAIVAGFFLRDPSRPLGEVRVEGDVIPHEPIEPPWAPRRGCVQVDGAVRIAPREDLGDHPAGHLVQAGPLLVAGGAPDGRRGSGGLLGRRRSVRLRHHSRPAPALRSGGQRDRAAGRVLRRAAVGGRRGPGAGRARRLLISFGAEEAINLDGGGSATLVHRRHLLNRPYSEYDQPAPESRPVVWRCSSIARRRPEPPRPGGPPRRARGCRAS